MGFPSVGIVGGRQLAPNADAVLYNLARLLDGRWDLHLAVGEADPPDRIKSYYFIHKFSLSGPDPLQVRYAFSATRYLARNIRPDLMINVTQPHTFGAAVALIGKVYGVPSVVRMTGDTFNEYRLGNSSLSRLRKRVAFNFGGRLAFSLAERIVPIGENLNRQLVQRGYLADKISVMPQPFDPTPFKGPFMRDKGVLKQELGLDPERLTVLFVGRVSWLKGADRLAEVARVVGQRSNRFQFCVVGDGEYAETLRREDNVAHFPGVPHQRIAGFYQAADLLIFPSRTEGLPNTLLEALASGLPVVATPVGEIPHYTSNLCESADCFSRFVMEADWAADPLPDAFDWDRQAAAYDQLFREVAGMAKDAGIGGSNQPRG